MAVMDFGSYENAIDKKKTIVGSIKCFLGFHHWLYMPHSLEISTREICTRKGCGCWKDCFDVVYKRKESSNEV